MGCFSSGNSRFLGWRVAIEKRPEDAVSRTEPARSTVQAPTLHLGIGVTHCERADVAVGGREVKEPPLARGEGIAKQTHEAAWFLWQARHFHLIQRFPNAFAGCLEPRLFAGPKIVERVLHFQRRKSAEHATFPGGKETFGYAISIPERADLLDVHSNLRNAGHRQQRQSARMRQVKMECVGTICPGEQRLAAGSVLELDLAGRQVKILSEKQAQRAASDDKPVSVPLEMKPTGARLFIRGKRRSQARNLRRRLIKAHCPNVDFVFSELPVFRRRRPTRRDADVCFAAHDGSGVNRSSARCVDRREADRANRRVERVNFVSGIFWAHLPSTRSCPTTANSAR